MCGVRRRFETYPRTKMTGVGKPIADGSARGMTLRRALACLGYSVNSGSVERQRYGWAEEARHCHTKIGGKSDTLFVESGENMSAGSEVGRYI